jgi:hypothetical protein
MKLLLKERHLKARLFFEPLMNLKEHPETFESLAVQALNWKPVWEQED